jgi:single-stranded-DNA-specific exonuclease
LGHKYETWQPISKAVPLSYDEVTNIIEQNRDFTAIEGLNYGDHGLEEAFEAIKNAIDNKKKIALYADYDVDGTMSCVSWIWFLKALGHTEFIHYIPDRFKEGYGVNLEAVKHLATNENADLIITMDTGITANEEARWCKENGIEFICTDHHKIQKDKMPDCIILNPKLHPDEMYQELCGCGITFVLLRKLGRHYGLSGPIWTDLLALTGMATICDIVPLNGVNHTLAKLGVQALSKSSREVLKKLLQAASAIDGADESDVGFKLGPRINAVGRLEHASKIVEAFVSENPDELIEYMGKCNEDRKKIQSNIVEKALELAEKHKDDPIIFIGYEDWHQGVVGIAASKLVETFWKPVWLYQKGDVCKGSARSIDGFDVTDAMSAAGKLFSKFGGHKAAGGFSFDPENEEKIREALLNYAKDFKEKNPDVWVPKITYDCKLNHDLLNLELCDSLESLKPFGHKFEQPSFEIESKVLKIDYYNDKTTGKPKHTAVGVDLGGPWPQKIMFFGDVIKDFNVGDTASFLVKVDKNNWKGRTYLSLMGIDYQI